MAPQYVAPQAGSGGVNLRSTAQVDPATLLGTLNENLKLELDQPGGQWHAAKVYVSAQVAGASSGRVAPLPGWDTINIRNTPSADPSTDVGDLKKDQSLELIGGPTNGWYVARVYLAAQFSQVISDQPAPPLPPGGLDVPSGSPLTLAELQAISLVPARKFNAPSGAGQAALNAARIWNKYGGVLEPLSARIGIDRGVAVAVIAVESAGSGMGLDGRMIIRFENHLFWSFWGRTNPAAYNQHFVFDQNTTWKGHKYRPQPNGPWLEVHQNQNSEWAAFSYASTIEATAAKKSISMGLVQIMGFNHRAIGYASPDAMFAAFAADEKFQLLGFFNFVKNDQRQVDALRNRNYVGFARIYNGPGQPDFYGGLIKGVVDGFNTLVAA
ncbi:MAG: N-acetylmuramidase family protein [Chloroflexi bacterium]|nr:N-acetylmuramidase family protein [Chloroflexota bacterium]